MENLLDIPPEINSMLRDANHGLPYGWEIVFCASTDSTWFRAEYKSDKEDKSLFTICRGNAQDLRNVVLSTEVYV